MGNDKALQRFLSWNKNGITEFTYNEVKEIRTSLAYCHEVITRSKLAALIFKRYGYTVKKNHDDNYIIS